MNNKIVVLVAWRVLVTVSGRLHEAVAYNDHWHPTDIPSHLTIGGPTDLESWTQTKKIQIRPSEAE